MTKKMMKKITMVVCAALTCTAFGGSVMAKGNEAKLTIAYQGGIGYAPIHVMEAKQLIEKNYDGEVEVTYQKLDSGADINTGLIGGTIDIGCMGVGPAVSAVSSGVPAKIISGLCSQSHGLMTNDPSIKTLADIGDTQIALVNIGSFQHIILAMACEKELGDAHALDNNIVKMSHAEGYAALESGTYKLHLTSSPFINRERENPNYTEITAVNDVWPNGNSFLVMMASEKLKEENEELFEAVNQSVTEAITLIHEQQEEAAEISAEYLQQDVETTLADLQDETCIFSAELKGVSEMADFMYRAGFLQNEVKFEDLKYDNVTGD